jgi:hypothetical protein
MAAAIVFMAAAGALVWWIWRAPNRDDLSTFGAFVIAVATIAITVLGLLRKASQGDAGQGQTADELADSLAGAVGSQWKKAAMERGLRPEPIPVRWKRSVLPLAGRVSAPAASQGGLPELLEVYGALGSPGRLVIVGPAGSGKSGAAVLLILAALEYRQEHDLSDKERSRVPVPVMFTLHGWDPGGQRLEGWLAERLQQTYPLFAGKSGLAKAAALVADSRIAVILDGLDEIPEELRPVALQAISKQAEFRVVLLSRTEEMLAAAQTQFLQGAVALELQDVEPVVAADYLERFQLDPLPRGWRELADRLRQAPDSPIAMALSSPLSLTLVRDTYDRAGDDVGDLLAFCDAAGGSTSREDIEDHLLDRVLPAAYVRQPGEPRLKYQLPAARHALIRIAVRMNQDRTRDLAWWQIPAWASPVPRQVVFMLLFGLVFGLGFGVPLGLWAGVTFGLVLGIMFGSRLGRGGGSPTRLAPQSLGKLFSRSVLEVGLRLGLVVGLVFGGLGGGLRVGLGLGIAGFLAAVLALWLFQPTGRSASPISPLASWHQDRAAGLVFGTLVGLLVGSVTWLAGGLPAGLGVGLAFCLVGTLFYSETWVTSLAFAQLARQWDTSAPRTRFLEDARQRDVLRTVGPAYQFRHARLQDRLAGQATSAKSAAGKLRSPS